MISETSSLGSFAAENRDHKLITTQEYDQAAQTLAIITSDNALLAKLICIGGNTAFGDENTLTSDGQRLLGILPKVLHSQIFLNAVATYADWNNGDYSWDRKYKEELENGMIKVARSVAARLATNTIKPATYVELGVQNISSGIGVLIADALRVEDQDWENSAIINSHPAIIPIFEETHRLELDHAKTVSRPLKDLSLSSFKSLREDVMQIARSARDMRIKVA